MPTRVTPGAFMDRSLLEGDPHAILEAMAIGGYAIGASEGLYLRARGVSHCREAAAGGHWPGTGIRAPGRSTFLAPAFNFDIHIRLGAGAFVCGEETALMNSIEGKRGEPRPRPPFPAVKGLFGKPTIAEQRGNLRQHSADYPQGRRSGSPPWVPNAPRAPRCLPWAARSTTPAWWRFPWAPPCATVIYDIGGGIPGRQEVQGRADRRPLRRLHPRGTPGYPHRVR